jgi:tRNA(Ile)-lysidine synthase
MNTQAASVPGAFERALETILARVCVSGGAGNASSPGDPGGGGRSPNVAAPVSSRACAIAVAYSGGLDSSVLLHLARAYAFRQGIPLFAFHIHHGISANADAWLTHCERECERLGIAFAARRIALARREDSGVEEAARLGRYAALGELCREHGARLLLTAHHQDDQAETVLLQLLRGSGVAGLGGMELANTAPDLLGDTTLEVARPLLAVTRAELEEFAAARRIACVEDESNTDPRYMRNALRHRVMPAFAAYFPGFHQRIARTARHAQAAQRLLDELAAQDLEQCRNGECIAIDRLRRLGPDRIDNALRYWFASRGVRMPSTSWLDEMRTQLLDAKADARICVTHPDCHVRRHRNLIFLVPRGADDPAGAPPVSFRWGGEAMLRFDSFCGTLHFDEAGDGIAAEWLRRQDLRIHHRCGGERLKAAPNRPTRSLKQHYQALDVPAWERELLPMVSAGDDLLFAAGIGMDCRHVGAGEGVRIRLRWQADNPQ